MIETESYVYKSEINWSILTEGLTLPVENQVVFARNMGHFLQRGETKKITLYLDGKGYQATIHNVNFDRKFNRKQDTLQIRYQKNGELALCLQSCFSVSYEFFKKQRAYRSSDDRSFIRLPDDLKEYIAIYTTEYDDSYIIETICSKEISLYTSLIKHATEDTIEQDINNNIKDTNANIFQSERLIKIRKLNRRISENLKLLYGYRCQICGLYIGQEYQAQVVESHHIEYFVESLNNDSENQLIVCPNHHRIIHSVNPVFDKAHLIYRYSNGLQEELKLNLHIKRAV
jgi:5-methylcytosine-specific restriction enzyme A